jgi:hypothetical protein
MKILAIGTERVVSKKILEKLNQKPDFSVIISESTQAEKIVDGSYDVMYVDLLHIGMDEEFEVIVDQIENGTIKVNKIVFLATAGMDNEIDPQWLEVQDLKELLLEVKYVAKLVDETELPYTILRPVEVQNEVQEDGFDIIAEGQQITDAKISEDALGQAVLEAIVTNNYINQSIGISSKR